MQEKEDTDGHAPVVPKLGSSEHENGAESAGPEADRLAIIADLLADLPESERQAVIADLAPADRHTIARLLIRRNSQGDRT